MDARLSRTPWVLAVVALMLVVVLIGQSMTDAWAPTETDTGRSIGRAGFAYLTGVRTFIAAVLWNRLDPQYHEYYGDRGLADQTQMMPTIRMVTLLDPQFFDAYYVAAWILVQRGELENGLALAKLGVANNPRSGLLRTSYAQILRFHGEDLPAAVEQADIALTDADWQDLFEKHDSYAVLKEIYNAAGQTAKAQYVDAEIARIDEQLGDALPPGAHDHDGDGKPDH